MATKKTAAKKSASKVSTSATSRKKTAGRSSATTKRAKTASKTGKRLIDHEAIRSWAEARNAKPSCVKKTGGKGDIGMIRLDFPGYSGEESLQEISWDEWFKKFDENNLALIVQETTADGQQSNFNKLVKRTAEDKRPRTRAAG